MGLTNDERSSLVELRLEKQKDLQQKQSKCFLWDYGLSAHTHAGTLGVFGMNFVKTGKNP